MAIRFGSKSETYKEFSNFAPFPFELDGVRWPAVEHYYQAQKFDCPEYRKKIREANTAAKAKGLGRTHKVPVRPDWDAVKDEVMYRAVRAKFLTHRALADLLLSTGDEELIEDVPTDYYWGAGRDGTGRNKLGQILMRVRAELRAQA